MNVWRSAAGSKKALCIAILGKIGTGKSSLINTLFGEQLSVEGQTLYAVTETTESITLMINAVRVTLWDTPGLKDPFSDGEETIRSMREACSIRDIDLFVYCTRFDQTRLSWDDIDCIRDITRGFGDEMWERALIALTFANEVGVPASCETSLQEYFQARESKWKGALHQVIKESVNLPAIKIDSIPIVATGYRDVPLPDGRNWFVDFWTACLSQANYITLPALVSVVHDQVQGTEGQTTVANAIVQQLAKLGHCIDLESEAETPQWLDTATFPARFARGITYTWDYLKSSVFSVTGVADYGATTLASITPMQNPAIIRETAVASGSRGMSNMHACTLIA